MAVRRGKARATAVCSQREVIPELIERLATEDEVELPEPFEAKKGSVWALSFDGERLCDLDYLAPSCPGIRGEGGRPKVTYLVNPRGLT